MSILDIISDNWNVSRRMDNHVGKIPWLLWHYPQLTIWSLKTNPLLSIATQYGVTMNAVYLLHPSYWT